MKIFDWYVFRNLVLATLFVAVTLAAVIFLTQSLRFLELVIESGASSVSFWVLTMLALPRFFEIILPLSLMAATLFVYNRMAGDSELIVIRAAGHSPATLARPAIVLSVIMTILLWGMTMYVAPKSLANMQHMRQVIKAQFSAYLFRDGVFNQLGDGLTVYIRERTPEGELRGMMIHDSREKNANPSTIMAKRGVVVSDDEGHRVLVYDGTRQEYDPGKKMLHRLNFERYAIDLPDSSPVRQRWREPEERTIFELLSPDLSNERDVESRRDFAVEIHRRIVAPLLAPLFVMISCVFMLLGPLERRGYMLRIFVAVIGVTVIQGLFLAAYSLARQSDLGLIFIYGLIVVPMAGAIFLLSGLADHMRRKILYSGKASA